MKFHMKSFRLTIVLGVAALVFAGGNIALAAVAGPEYTYVFTANPDSDTSYNGSTISIQSLSIVNWDLKGPGVEFTMLNSFIFAQSILSYDQNTWSGSFTIDGNSSPVRFTGDAGGGIPDNGDLSSQSFDPPGVWTPLRPSVPDSGSTVQLLAIACVGLGACQWSRRRRVV
jgi:hypothetical protein